MWLLLFFFQDQDMSKPRIRELGIQIGILATGQHNSITDVPNVSVGHKTVIQGENVRTGVTVILPHSGNLYQKKVPAAVYCGNAYGKLAGSTQVQELGVLETPIALTNTLSVPTAMQALIRHTLNQAGNEQVRSVNALVGETNDGYLNDIRGFHIKEEHVFEALKNASPDPVQEGNVGAGTGTSCFGFKGGIGNASRKIPNELGGYHVGVLVQTNYGGVLTINGVEVGKALGKFPLKEYVQGDQSGGSCMVIVATDAPLGHRNLERLAKRALLGLGRTGSAMNHGSGDFVIAFTTAYTIPNQTERLLPPVALLSDNHLNPLFMAVVEATEEAVYNSLFRARNMQGNQGHTREALPLDKVIQLLKPNG